jgi:hypothetical protein
MFSCGKTRAEGDYNQGNRGTQVKIAKKAGKMRVFWRRVEITAKTAGCERFERRCSGLEAWRCPFERLSNANIRPPDAHWANLRNAGGSNQQQCSENLEE